MFQTFFNRIVSPQFILHLHLSLCFYGFGKGNQLLGGFVVIVVAVEQNVLAQVAEFGFYFIVNYQLPGVYNAHVHTCFNCIVKENAVHSFAHMIVSSKAERNIGNTATYFGKRHPFFNLTGSFNKINRVVVVFLNSGGYGKNIGVENNILRGKTNLFSQYFVCPVANFYFSFLGIGLSFFIKSHYNYCCTISLANLGLFNKFGLALLHAYGVYNALALHAFKPRLNDFKFGAVNHNRDAGNIGLGLQQVEEGSHSGYAFKQRIIHVYIQYLSAAFHLLSGHIERCFVVVFPNKTSKHFASRYIGTFPYIYKIGFGTNHKWFKTCKTEIWMNDC